MANIFWSDVLAVAPELTSVSITAQTYILGHVNSAIKGSELDGESGWRTRMTRIWLAAHLGSLTGKGDTGSGGPVTSESAGGLSRSYGTVSASEGSFGLTVYGRQYLLMIETSLAALPFVP